jgi:aromatic amino acid aminotransferase I
MRLDWFTCSPLFAERLERIGENSTQAPCGLGQVLLARMNFRWLTYAGCVVYAIFVDCLAEEFDLIPTHPSGYL